MAHPAPRPSASAVWKLRDLRAHLIEYQLLLLVGAIAALLWANTGHDSYERFAQAAHFFVNDVAMVFFFGIAAKEVVEATAPGGTLSSWRRASLPVVAATGGMAGPALIYVGLAMWLGRPDLLRGWAIPCATDIAFSYLAARAIFAGQHPAIPFLLLLAIADDALGLVILAVFYPIGTVRLIDFAVILAAAFGAAWWLRRRRTLSFWPYIVVPGLISWVALFRGGLHPALALVPIMPFLPHAARDAGLFVGIEPAPRDALNQFQRWWTIPVQIILFFFGLVNAGVPLTSVGAGTWIVLTALLVGKPIGIGLSTLASVAIGLRVPHGVNWREMLVVGVAAGIGFTVALFFCTASFPPGARLDEAKMGALLSFSAAILTVMVAIVLRVGRFERRSRV
jgi:NhaA family Na+:H+ antiporter